MNYHAEAVTLIDNRAFTKVGLGVYIYNSSNKLRPKVKYQTPEL